ncbi:Acylphosphate phosphohydrolase, putative [Salipiger mucosus DSM 16094]|uniref:acylphosphatase n=1 Tax=Salipiger mucosus DSM 16094 TaxID=1123237 RepID=S9QVH5_9RHOB|nr:Acylphosphate phosphohydrolase, putative [Salipiger mucosus DSM 16094]
MTGRVQGVWFRAWTEEQALGLGLTGWVRNRADGAVEAMIAGSDEAVATMLARFHQGSPASSVSEVRHDPCEAPEDTDGFEVRS